MKKSKEKSDQILNDAEELEVGTMKSLQNQRARMQSLIDELLPKLEEISNEYKHLNLSIPVDTLQVKKIKYYIIVYYRNLIE